MGLQWSYKTIHAADTPVKHQSRPREWNQCWLWRCDPAAAASAAAAAAICRWASPGSVSDRLGRRFWHPKPRWCGGPRPPPVPAPPGWRPRSFQHSEPYPPTLCSVSPRPADTIAVVNTFSQYISKNTSTLWETLVPNYAPVSHLLAKTHADSDHYFLLHRFFEHKSGHAGQITRAWTKLEHVHVSRCQWSARLKIFLTCSTFSNFPKTLPCGAAAIRMSENAMTFVWFEIFGLYNI